MKLSQNFKICFVPEMSKEFSKGAFNGSQNLKNLARNRFVSLNFLRLKQMLLRSQGSPKKLLRWSGLQNLIIYTLLFTMYEVWITKRMSTQWRRLWRGEFEFFYGKFSFRAELGLLKIMLSTGQWPFSYLCHLQRCVKAERLGLCLYHKMLRMQDFNEIAVYLILRIKFAVVLSFFASNSCYPLLLSISEMLRRFRIELKIQTNSWSNSKKP